MLLLTGVKGFSQKIYKINATRTGEYNDQDEAYVWGDWHHQENMTLTIKGKLIMISDEAGSYYITGKLIDDKKYETCEAVTWAATDEKNRSCQVRYYFFNDGITIHITIFYNDVAYEYDIPYT